MKKNQDQPADAAKLRRRAEERSKRQRPEGGRQRVETLLAQRKRAEDALRESEERFRKVFDEGPLGMVMTSTTNGQFVQANGAFCRMLGYAEEELKRLTFADVTNPEHRAADVDAINRLCKKQILQYSTEKRYVKKNGEIVWALLVASLIHGQNRKPLYFLAMIQDITERKQAEQRMQRFSQKIIAVREKEREHVSSALHHDVGSLAVGLLAHLDAIQEDLRSGRPREALKWVRRTRKLFGESMTRLKGLATHLRPPELNVLGLRAALRQYFSQATSQGITRIHFTETLGRRRLSGEAATTLFRVAQEALTNAIAHGHAKRVDVRLSASKREVRLTVRDKGKGFDPSKHTAGSTPRVGLRVMKEMVVSAGGAFTIDSRPGKGTTVRVRVPLETVALAPGDVTVEEKTMAREQSTRFAGPGTRPQKASGA